MEHVSAFAEAVDRLRRERPHVRAFVDPFLGLLLAREPLVAVLRGADAARPAPRPDSVRLAQGACLEARDEFPLHGCDLERAFEVLQPALTAGFRDVRGDLAVIARTAQVRQGFVEQAARDCLCDRNQSLARAANGIGVDARVLAFWITELLAPLAMARGRRLSGAVAEMPWNRGYCPVCGSWPGFVRREASGGGVMACSFCAATWRFSRRECPFCEAPGPSAQVYAVPGFDSERVVVCRRCNHYLAELADDALAGYPPEAAGLALAPLELLARQHGHRPAVMDWRQMPWA